MNEKEKTLLVMAHALGHQENEIHYLKAPLVEKIHMNIEDFQQEQDEFWTKTKHYRIYETLKTLQALQQDMESLPEDLNLDLYMDHLRWPSDPPEDQSWI